MLFLKAEHFATVDIANFLYLQELQLEVEEKRLKVEAINANALSDERKLRESFEEHIKVTKDSYEKKLEKQKLDYIVEHSNSKVAELNGKLHSYEILQEHMKGVIEEAKQDRKKLEQAKVRIERILSKVLHIKTVFYSRLYLCLCIIPQMA